MLGQALGSALSGLGQVVAFVGILGQIVKFGLSGVPVLGLCGDVLLVGQDEFPVAIDQPAISEVRAWFVDVDCVVKVDSAVG